jgi:hypothetical protein
VPIHTHNAAKRLEPKGIAHTPEETGRTIFHYNRFNDCPAEPDHSFRQPAGNPPVMKGKICRTCSHHNANKYSYYTNKFSNSEELIFSGLLFETRKAGIVHKK